MSLSPSDQPAESAGAALELPVFTDHLINNADAAVAARHYLQDAREALAAAFFPGKSIRPLLRKTSKCVDTVLTHIWSCLLYTSPSPRDLSTSRMPSSA